MNKLIGIILIGCLVVSCSSKADLEALKLDEDISKVIEGHKELRKNLAGSYGLKGYSSTKLDGFKIGSVKISSYEVPKGNVSDHSDLWIYIDNYNAKKLLGYKYSSADEEESEKILDYLKSKYKGYKTNINKVHGDFYFWDLPEANKWIFVDQYDCVNHIQTNFTIVKRGLRIEDSTSKSVNTIYDDYKMGYPDLLK
ncbi:hypothetical protein SAMN05421827_12722 [Pedobacter terrae]|uniref:Lipoprotein n=1 Tax=Pedobacter terrae TaxID=405671 RepID=A0A1G8CZA4_9SPHI|nr:hypothetical protein [Pedobacter terrae]SDH50260.1 hypothetical protein SAMN05421827_12722 [Pedobacter terrae]